MPKGDLWALVDAHLAARGHSSVNAFKVKAHTSANDVQRGLNTFEQQQGNERADQLAAEGDKSLAQDIYQLSAVYARKHRIYGVVVKAIRRHILDTIEYARNRRDRQARLGFALSLPSDPSGVRTRVRTLVPGLPAPPCPDSVRALHPWQLALHAIPCNAWCACEHCRAFLGMLRIALVFGDGHERDQRQGTSWIEHDCAFCALESQCLNLGLLHV